MTSTRFWPSMPWPQPNCGATPARAAPPVAADTGRGRGTMPAPTMPWEVGGRERRKNQGGPEGWYEKLYYMLLGSIPFSLILIDRALRVVSANRNFLEKAQRSEGDTIGA